MQVFIVMIESIYSSHTQWDICCTFSTMEAAEAYVAKRQAEYKSIYDRPDFDIEIATVYEYV